MFLLVYVVCVFFADIFFSLNERINSSIAQFLKMCLFLRELHKNLCFLIVQFQFVKHHYELFSVFFSSLAESINFLFRSSLVYFCHCSLCYTTKIAMPVGAFSQFVTQPGAETFSLFWPETENLHSLSVSSPFSVFNLLTFLQTYFKFLKKYKYSI
jgi:hypothetical protein